MRKILVVLWAAMCVLAGLTIINANRLPLVLVYSLLGGLNYFIFKGQGYKKMVYFYGVFFLLSLTAFIFAGEGRQSGMLAATFVVFFAALNLAGALAAFLLYPLFDEKKASKRRVLSGLGGGIVVALLLQASAITFGTFSQRTQARFGIRAHLAQNFERYELVFSGLSFDFEKGSFFGTAASPAGGDLFFNVYYSPSTGAYDDFEESVLRFQNTLFRLETIYTYHVREVMAKELSLLENKTTVIYDRDTLELHPEAIKLDMEFDPDLPLSAVLVIQYQPLEDTLEELVANLQAIYFSLEKAGFHFSVYHVIAGSFRIEGLGPIDLGSAELLDRARQGFLDTPHIRMAYQP